MNKFLENDLSLESQWRSLIQFGRNSATYKFSFAKTLLELSKSNKSHLNLKDLSEPFALNMVEHLKKNNKQGNSLSSNFLNVCRKFNQKEIDKDILLQQTEKLGFVNVIDAFQNIEGGIIPNKFYKKNFNKGNKEIILTDNFFKLCEGVQFDNLSNETESRWKLVETAWNLNLNPNMIVSYDDGNKVLFIIDNSMRRVDITSARNALNGYQKGKCFYSFKDLHIGNSDLINCDVDHVLPHFNKILHLNSMYPTNINGVWNLVLSDIKINRHEKRAKFPALKYLERLHKRNEYYIISKHPLSETIINQTGKTENDRIQFLQYHWNIAKENCIHQFKTNEITENKF
jgi:hypothetical protein|tara:strand:- start:546 stop:1577 length:1032 start_codon:yes stop_codon:yes gene_type:complete